MMRGLPPTVYSERMRELKRNPALYLFTRTTHHDVHHTHVLPGDCNPLQTVCSNVWQGRRQDGTFGLFSFAVLMEVFFRSKRSRSWLEKRKEEERHAGSSILVCTHLN